MKKENSCFLSKAFIFFMLVFTSIGSALAQSPNVHRYQVFSARNAVSSNAIVETSVSGSLVSVVIQRNNQPVHYYNSYPEVKASTARIGRKTLYTIYHKEQRIEAGQFDKKISEVTGIARSQRTEVAPIRGKLEEDMKILRAIRAFDAKADVILAELSYTIVTYDNSIIDVTDNDALKNFSVSELASTSKSNLRKDISRIRADKVESARIFRTVSFVRDVCSLSQCKQEAYDRYNECKTDEAIVDKTICYNNRSSEIQTCYNNCSDGPPVDVKPGG